MKFVEKICKPYQRIEIETLRRVTSINPRSCHFTGTKPLNILVVGSGMAGCSAATACARAGHDVQIYERSALNNELGAAIHVFPNASRELLAWGLSPVKARLATCKRSFRAHRTTMVRFPETDDHMQLRDTDRYGFLLTELTCTRSLSVLQYKKKVKKNLL